MKLCFTSFIDEPMVHVLAFKNRRASRNRRLGPITAKLHNSHTTTDAKDPPDEWNDDARLQHRQDRPRLCAHAPENLSFLKFGRQELRRLHR